MDNIFIETSILLAITVSIAFLIRMLNQPLVIAYIIAGITAGPMFFNLLHNEKNIYDLFAKFGVVLLLFIIGLNLNFNHLKSIGKVSIISGLGQVIFTSFFGVLILIFLGESLISAIYLAIAITFSSTIIIMKLLSDKNDIETIYGKYTIGLMLVQDIVAIIIMFFISIIQGEKNGISNIQNFLPLAILSILTIILFSKYFLPKILDKISYSSELLFIFTITWCFSVASILHLAGLSIEMGAIIAGISLSSSPYQPEIGSRIKPLRDFFLVIFFIVLGAEMSFGSLSSTWIPGIVLSLFILIGNPLILYFIFRKLKFTRRNSFLAGLTAAQVSEFGFVLLFTGQHFGHVNSEIISIFTLVAIITIFISSYLIIYNEKIYHWLLPLFQLFGPDKYRQFAKIDPVYDIWLIGHHRIGKRAAKTFKKIKANFAVIDYNPEVLRELKKNKIPAIFGDVADIELLENIPITGAKIVFMTIPSLSDQLNLINYMKKQKSKAVIVASAYQYHDAQTLYKNGADFVMMPHLLGGDWIANLIENNKLTKSFFSHLKEKQMKTFKEEDVVI